MVSSSCNPDLSADLSKLSTGAGLNFRLVGSKQVEWLFCPGMMFGSLEKWWGRPGRRRLPHEGLDFYLFRVRPGDLQQLPVSSIVSALLEGELVAVFEDFLGETIIIRHPQYQQDGKALHTIYAHLTPLPEIRPTGKIHAGRPLATLADSKAAGSKAPPHFHFSVAFIPPGLNLDGLRWHNLTEYHVDFCDPLIFLEINYRIVTDSELTI